LEHLFDQGWEITPAGGATGEAFIAEHDQQKLFLKRNSSPFLAVLSAEGIVPKLVWTKRLENGDVITAQRWLAGRELEKSEMNNERVARLLRKIHSSRPLLKMLKRMGKAPLKPKSLLAIVEKELDDDIQKLPKVVAALDFLRKELFKINSDKQVVCHTDVNHNNWLLAENNQLYLIDWDGALIGDPAIDLGMMLYWHIPQEHWEEWVHLYGITLSDDLLLRMKWYVVAQTLTSIQWHKEKERLAEMDKWIRYLEEIL
jgi:thiamine kinase-like enzyme